jgi:hypothetical protein
MQCSYRIEKCVYDHELQVERTQSLIADGARTKRRITPR